MSGEADWPRRLEGALRSLVPLATSLLLVVVCALPIGLAGAGPVTPMVALMAVYYWSVNRPDLMPLTGGFLIGFVHDALSGVPLGLTSLVLVAVQAAVAGQHRTFAGKPFLLVWFGFALTASGAVLFGWILASAWFAVLLRPGPLVFQLLVSLALFPSLAWLLGALERDLLHTARAGRSAPV